MNILISGIGGPTPIGIAKSIRLKTSNKDVRIIGVDGDPFAPGLYNQNVFDKTCLNTYTRYENYWEVMEAIVEKEKIDIAFIVPEQEILGWAKKQEKDQLPCKSLIPDYTVAKSLYNKFECYKLLNSTDLVPKSIKIDRKLPLRKIGEELNYPYWVRKGSGAGAAGAFKINNHEELNQWLNINPNIEDFLASEFLPGRNYACKMLYHNGELLRAACGERIDYLLSNAAPSGISGMCSRGKLINNVNLIEKSDLAIKTIFKHYLKAPHGMFTVDLKEDEQGIPKITEINIRHVSFTLAFAMGGANFSYDMLELLTNNQLSDNSYKEYTFNKDYHFIRGVDTELFIISDNNLKSKP